MQAGCSQRGVSHPPGAVRPERHERWASREDLNFRQFGPGRDERLSTVPTCPPGDRPRVLEVGVTGDLAEMSAR